MTLPTSGSFPRNTFFAEVLVGVFGRSEEEVGQGIGDEAVHFLGHGAVEAAEAGLDVGDFDAELGADEGAGHGGVDVSDDNDPVGFLLEHDGLEPGHDVGVCMACEPEPTSRLISGAGMRAL